MWARVANKYKLYASESGNDAAESMALGLDVLLTLTVCALPIVGFGTLARAKGVWDRAETYSKPNEYGEFKDWASSIRTPWNAWSSLAYYYAGVYLSLIHI